MPDTIESELSRATRDALVEAISQARHRRRRRAPKPLKCKWDFEFPGGLANALGTLRKSRGLLTHRPGRCNIANLRPWLANLRRWLANLSARSVQGRGGITATGYR